MPRSRYARWPRTRRLIEKATYSRLSHGSHRKESIRPLWHTTSSTHFRQLTPPNAQHSPTSSTFTMATRHTIRRFPLLSTHSRCPTFARAYQSFRLMCLPMESACYQGFSNARYVYRGLSQNTRDAPWCVCQPPRPQIPHRIRSSINPCQIVAQTNVKLLIQLTTTIYSKKVPCVYFATIRLGTWTIAYSDPGLNTFVQLQTKRETMTYIATVFSSNHTADSV